jgi:Xaa-Pro aminopeptidase
LKQGIQDVPTWQEWSAEQAEGGKVVAVDPTLLTSGTAKKLSEKIQKSGGKKLEAVSGNLIDLVWGSDKPSRPSEPVIILDEKFAGKGVNTKLVELRKELEKRKSLGFVISMLDEIAWLFNLRGNDIPYNPVFFSYAIVTQDEATLYIDSSKLSSDVQAFLEKNKVAIKPYQDIFADSTALGETATANKTDSSDKKKFLISNRASWALKRALGGDDLVEEVRSPLVDAKALKNETELEGMRACHIRDGAALIEYFAWLEDQLVVKKATIDEVEGADKLEAIRAKHKDFVGLSFDTISSTGPK